MAEVWMDVDGISLYFFIREFNLWVYQWDYGEYFVFHDINKGDLVKIGVL